MVPGNGLNLNRTVRIECWIKPVQDIGEQVQLARMANHCHDANPILKADTTHWQIGKSAPRVGTKIVRHTKYVTFQIADVAVPRWLYRAMLQRIRRLADTSIRPTPT